MDDSFVRAARVSRRGLTVLVITGFAATALRANGDLDPGLSVLTKPFAVDALAARIPVRSDPARPPPCPSP